MATYALVKNKVVANLVVWDGKENFPIGADEKLVEISEGQRVDIGWLESKTGEFVSQSRE